MTNVIAKLLRSSICLFVASHAICSAVAGAVDAASAVDIEAASNRYNFPGGLVQLQLKKPNSEIPEVKYGLLEPVILDSGQDWRILVGIDLNTIPGEYLVYVKPQEKGLSASHLKFRVQQYSYPHDQQASSPILGSFVEYKSFSDLDYQNTQQPSLPLLLPTQGGWADFFGHTAFDPVEQNIVTQNMVSLTTTELLTISSPQNAIVSKVIVSKVTAQADQTSTVFLDHGRGLYSIISGLSDLTVETGNGIVAGAVIGKLSAQNSNALPRRLTWQCVLNGTYVNPFILTQISS